MEKHTTIPARNGLYWYFERSSPPVPVLVDRERHGAMFKAFNGSVQGWLRDGEYLLGPVPVPDREPEHLQVPK